MATFWQRATGFGADPSEIIDINTLCDAMLLKSRNKITWDDAKNWLDLTPEQRDEADYLLYFRMPGPPDDIEWCVQLGSLLRAARAGLDALDSAEKVRLALGYDPEVPPEE